jgi:hypothetical protein
MEKEIIETDDSVKKNLYRLDFILKQCMEAKSICSVVNDFVRVVLANMNERN